MIGTRYRLSGPWRLWPRRLSDQFFFLFGSLGKMKIIVYTKTHCGWCETLKRYLKEKHISFEERNVTENDQYFKEMVEKSGQMFAPTLDIDGEILADAGVKELAEFLKRKYPDRL